MDNLQELITKKAKELSATQLPHSSERSFFEALFNCYSVNNIKTFNSIKNSYYLAAVLLSNDIKMPFQEVMDKILVLEDFLDMVDFDNNLYSDYLTVLSELNDKGILKSIVNKENFSCEDHNLIEKYKMIKHKLFLLYNEEVEKEEYQAQIAEALDKLFLELPIKSKFESFIELKEISNDVREEIADLLGCALDEVLDDEMFDAFDKTVTQSRRFNRMVEKEKERFINKFIRDLMKSEYYINIRNDFDMMVKHNQRICKIDKEIVSTTNKKIRALQDFEYKLKYISDKRPLKIDDEMSKYLFDAEIKHSYLLLAIAHNLNIYQKEEEKNIEFNNNSLTKLEILFSKYGFNFNDFNEEEKQIIIDKTNAVDVENILNSVRYSELVFISDYSTEFMKIIISSKPEIIKFVDSLLKNKIIDKKFIFKNINILYDADMFKCLYNNINYLNSIGVNLINLSKNNPEILLLNNEQIITKTNILSEYQFKLDSEEVYNFEYLKDDKMLDLLDNYIELGLKDIVLENPKYITEKGFNIVKRIMICNLIGLNPLNKSHRIIGSVSTGNNFYVKPEDYDNFIIDYKEDYQNPKCVEILENNSCDTISLSTKSRMFIKKLDELYMKDELTYVIDGVVISRNRVLRNLEVLIKHLFGSDMNITDLVYQAILYKMINNVEPEVLEKIYQSISMVGLNLDNPKTYTLK